MSESPSMLPAGEALLLESLVTPTAQGIASRVLAKTAGGSVTMFVFDASQGLSEHTAPVDALLFVLSGEMTVTVGGTPALATAGTVVRLPGGVPHAVDAITQTRMLLAMLR